MFLAVLLGIENGSAAFFLLTPCPTRFGQGEERQTMNELDITIMYFLTGILIVILDFLEGL